MEQDYHLYREQLTCAVETVDNGWGTPYPKGWDYKRLVYKDTRSENPEYFRYRDIIQNVLDAGDKSAFSIKTEYNAVWENFLDGYFRLIKIFPIDSFSDLMVLESHDKESFVAFSMKTVSGSVPSPYPINGWIHYREFILLRIFDMNLTDWDRTILELGI